MKWRPAIIGTYIDFGVTSNQQIDDAVVISSNRKEERGSTIATAMIYISTCCNQALYDFKMPKLTCIAQWRLSPRFISNVTILLFEPSSGVEEQANDFDVSLLTSIAQRGSAHRRDRCFFLSVYIGSSFDQRGNQCRMPQLCGYSQSSSSPPLNNNPGVGLF